jgi:hypothetical protein
MVVLEDLISGKYNLVLININIKTELMGELDISPQLKEAIKQVYMVDVTNKLQKEGLTIPINGYSILDWNNSSCWLGFV